MFKSRSNPNLFIAFILLFIIGITGVSGYMLIEGYSFLEAAFMTVNTVATVGFKGANELSSEGKVFTIFLIIFSFSIFAYSLTTITSYFLESRLNALLEGNRKSGGLKKMKDHIIIVGYGRNGQQTTHDLQLLDKAIVVIEKNHEIILAHQEEKVVFVEGDATEDETLEKAGIRKALALITTLPTDADNLYVVLTARSLCPHLQIISRASYEASYKKLLTAGASHVVMPEKIGGTFMASLVAKPDLAEFFHQLSIEGSEGVNLVEVVCSDLPGKFRGHTIHDMSIRRLTGANIVGFRTPEGQYIINPSGDTVMLPDSKLFVLGTPEQIEKVKEIIREGKKELI
jgi:voltage-gated potassium channel